MITNIQHSLSANVNGPNISWPSILYNEVGQANMQGCSSISKLYKTIIISLQQKFNCRAWVHES